MNGGGRWTPALTLLLLAPGPLLAQAGGSVFEWGAHATVLGVSGGPVGVLGGPRLAVRTLGSARLALSAGVGFRGDQLSGRGEAAVEYLLSPRAANRLGVYFGGGLAGVVGGGKGGYMLVYLGVEQSPGLLAGWAFEGGLGGGFRVRAAYHWRRFPKGWRAGQ